MAGRKFAAFDIDGTVIRWQLYHAIGDGMLKQGFIEPEAFAPVRKARMNWKRRAGEDSFLAYEQALVKVFDQALKGTSVGDFKKVVGRVFDEYKEQTYTYTRQLIQTLQEQDYLLFAVSGSPSMIVELFAGFYGFDDFAATEYPVKEGCYTGEKVLSMGRKAELLKALIKKHNAGKAGSISVGDSEGDIGMLELAARPIAFNPSRSLFEHATKQGWEIVLERKNMVYELKQSDGSYLLA